jgi:hypothetical protein
MGLRNMKAADRGRVIRQLEELIEALDRRVPMIEREGETRIAREAAVLKEKAVRRLRELQNSKSSAP